MLNFTGRRILLGVHIILISVWKGSLLALLFIQLCKHSEFAAADIDIADRLIFAINDSIVMNMAIAVAITGLFFSMFTKWGFFKFYWIIGKWIILALLGITIVFFSGPAINGMTALSDVFQDAAINNVQYKVFEENLVVYTLLQLLLLAGLILLSIIKPWGQRDPRFNLKRKVVIATGSSGALLTILLALLQYNQLKYYRQLPVRDIAITTLPDGDYQGRVHYNDDYQVQVFVKEQTIRDIKILNPRDNFYARLAENVRLKVLAQQKVNVDAVSGATTTSKVLLKAMEKALTVKQLSSK
jgi:uncharacterized protein with FMN-binding domain